MKLLSRFRRFHIFCSNRHARNSFRPYVTSTFWEKIPITYTCVDPLQISEAASSADRHSDRKRFGFADDDPVVLCIAQFIDRKGRWIFLEAARLIGQHDHGVKFVWVTPSLPTGDDLKRIDSFGLGESFHLILSESIGSKRLDVLRFYAAADVFAHASIIDGLPIAILEAMAMGLPTVASRVYAVPEAVEDNVTGLLVASEDPQALAGAITSLLKNNDLRQRLGSAGRERVLKDFDERVASAIAIREYEQCFNAA